MTEKLTKLERLLAQVSEEKARLARVAAVERQRKMAERSALIAECGLTEFPLNFLRAEFVKIAKKEVSHG